MDNLERYNDGKWKDYENEASGMQNKKMRGYVDNEENTFKEKLNKLITKNNIDYSDYARLLDIQRLFFFFHNHLVYELDDF